MRLLALTLVLVFPAFAQTPAPSLFRLQAELKRLTAMTEGTAGIAAIHIESGRAVDIRGTEPFPLASTVKIPVALTILKKLEDGGTALDKRIDIKASDIHPGSGILIEYFPHGGLALSLENLIELMLLDSDNAATDLVIAEAGGIPSIRARLKELHISEIDVSRNIFDLLTELVGVKGLPQDGNFRVEEWSRRAAALSPAEANAASTAFYASPQDTATPRAMAELLARLYRGELLTADSTKRLIDWMERCRTGKARLKGLLPKDTVVAHKTGSLGLVADDVGIITLPNGAGHVAIAAFVKGVAGPEKERIIAELARTVHDYFVFETTE